LSQATLGFRSDEEKRRYGGSESIRYGVETWDRDLVQTTQLLRKAEERFMGV
jgi:hypothetical protein